MMKILIMPRTILLMHLDHGWLQLLCLRRVRKVDLAELAIVVEMLLLIAWTVIMVAAACTAVVMIWWIDRFLGVMLPAISATICS